MHFDYTLKKLDSIDKIHFDLLLLADETMYAIEKYIFQSDVFIITESAQIVPLGIFALYKLNDTDIEIKNIAVSEDHQHKGVGSLLIREIIEIGRRAGYLNVIVGTSAASDYLIRFYEKNGFSIFDVRKNFFLENYTEPIIENGILLKDMVLLKQNIS